MKTILAVILSLALLLSPAADAAGRSGPVMAVDTMTVSPGQTVEVPIRLSGNTGLAGIRLTISYSQSLTLTQITKGEALSTLTMTPPGKLSDNPVNILWDGTEADTSDGVMAYLHFTAPEQPGRYVITLSYEPGNMVDGQLIPQPVLVALTHGAVIVAEDGEEPEDGDEPGDTPADGLVIAADSVTALPGQPIQVPIRISNNTGLLGIRLTISYGQGLTLTKITKGDALSSLIMTPPGDLSANPINILWDGIEAEDSDGILAVLWFTAPSQPGDYEIELSYGKGDIVNGEMETINVSLISGNIAVNEKHANIELAGNTSSSAEIILTNLGSEHLSAFCIVAAYDEQNQMVASCTESISLESQKALRVSLAYEAEEDVRQLKVFLLSPNTLIPLQQMWSTELSEQ